MVCLVTTFLYEFIYLQTPLLIALVTPELPPLGTTNSLNLVHPVSSYMNGRGM